MLKSIAYRSSKAVAANHAVVKEMAAGEEAPQLSAKQLLVGNGNYGIIRYSLTTPREPDAPLGEALLSDDHYEEVSDNAKQQPAIAATMIAADLIETGSLDAVAVYPNLD